MFSRQDAKNLCDRVAQDNPKVVEDLVPKLLPLATVQRVIQNLLRERVPIRDSVNILEALGEAAQTSKNPVLLTEYVRQAIRRGIVQPLVNAQGELSAYLLDPVDRAHGRDRDRARRMNSSLSLPPDNIRDILARFGRKIEKTEAAVVVASAGSRYFVRQIAGNVAAECDRAVAQRDSVRGQSALQRIDRIARVQACGSSHIS